MPCPPRSCGRLAVTAVAALALLVPVVPAGAQPAPNDAKAEEPESVLAVVTAAAGRLDVGKDGTGTLTLRGTNRRAVWFSDRPNRDTGTYSLAELEEVFFEEDADDPPNAALEVPSADDEGDVVILELTEPEIDGRTVTFAVTVLEEPREQGVDGALAAHHARVDEEVGPALKDPVLFVDSAAAYGPCGFEDGLLLGINGITCTEAKGVVSSAGIPAACPQSGGFETSLGTWKCRPISSSLGEGCTLCAAQWIATDADPLTQSPGFIYEACSQHPDLC